MTSRKAVALVVLVLTLVGCSQQQAPQAVPTITVTAPVPTVTVTVTSSAGPSGAAEVTADATYDSVEDLRDAYVAIGYECPDWKQSDVVRFATESGECDTDTVLSVFANDDDVESQVQAWKDFYKEMGSDREAYLIVGPNWIINAADQRVAGVQMMLGGEIVTNQD